MVSPIRCLSHEVGSLGGVSQKLVERILEPETPLQKWTIFIRETFQNSNDQRKSADEKIGFKVKLLLVPEEGRKVLGETFSQDEPFQSDPSLDSKKTKSIDRMLLVVDTNTKGLSGSRNPGIASETESNFNNFFFFVGQLKEKEHGGGIFGVGRNVLFSASKIRTILAFSVFENESGTREQIFMGMSATDSFEHERKLYTGRHWWGKVAADKGQVAPYLGSEAEELARKFEMLRLLDGKTGTVFAILDPDLSDVENELKLMADSFLVHAWPHLLSGKNGQKSTEVEFSSLSQSYAVIDPLAPESPVRNFAKAFSNNGGGLVIRSHEHRFMGDVKTLSKYEVKRKVMGESRWIQKDSNFEEDPEWLSSLGMHPGNSIALLRSSNLVIRYEFERIHQNTDAGQIRGVFVVDPDYEKVFRDSENATHDNWSHGEITLPTKGAKNPVRQFWNQLSELFSFKSDSARTIGTGDEDHAADIASMLGNLVPIGLPFAGKPNPPMPPDGPGGGGGGGGTSIRKTISFEDSNDPEITERNDESCVGQFFLSPLFDGLEGRKYSLQVKTNIWLGDAYEVSAPRGSREVEVEKVEVREKDGTIREIQDTTSLTASEINKETEIVVTIRYPLLAQVACDVVAELQEEVSRENA